MNPRKAVHILGLFFRNGFREILSKAATIIRIGGNDGTRKILSDMVKAHLSLFQVGLDYKQIQRDRIRTDGDKTYSIHINGQKIYQPEKVLKNFIDFDFSETTIDIELDSYLDRDHHQSHALKSSGKFRLDYGISSNRSYYEMQVALQKGTVLPEFLHEISAHDDAAPFVLAQLSRSSCGYPNLEVFSDTLLKCPPKVLMKAVLLSLYEGSWLESHIS